MKTEEESQDKELDPEFHIDMSHGRMKDLADRGLTFILRHVGQTRLTNKCLCTIAGSSDPVHADGICL